MKQSTLDTLDALIADAEYYGPPREGEFTIYEYIERVNQTHGVKMAHRTALGQLDEMIDQGKIIVRQGMVNKRRGNVYRRA